MESLGTFRQLPQLLLENDVISTDNYFRIVDQLEGIKYLKRDFIFKSGVWRGNKISSLISNRKEYTNQVLVLGHSDIATKVLHQNVLRYLGVHKIFGTNLLPFVNYSTCIPLGVTNDCDDSPVHRILGDLTHFETAGKAEFYSEDFDAKLYLNFSITNNINCRKKLYLIAKKLSKTYNMVFEEPDFTPKGRINFLKQCRSSSAVLCPEGNGFDTHRLWETLYMGGIPIVTRNKALQSIYDRLPIIQLNSWNQLKNRTLLEAQWYRIQKTQYDFNSLRMSYWINKMQESRHQN